MKAEICPVCHGTGKYTPAHDPMMTAVPESRTCHGCGGKGWVELREDMATPAQPRETYSDWYTSGT